MSVTRDGRSETPRGVAPSVGSARRVRHSSPPPGPPEPEPEHNLEITIVFRPQGATSTYAPYPIQWRVDNLDGLWGLPIAEFDVEWDYDDDYAFQAIADAPAEYNLGDRRSGTSLGVIGGHVYRQPGQYHPKVTIRARGHPTIEVECPPVVVTDPNTFYAGTQTVCLSRDGDFTGAPAGAQLVTVTDPNGVVPSGGWNTEGGLQNRRILFRRGQEFWFGTSLRRPNITLGSFGPEPGYARMLRGLTALGASGTGPIDLRIFGLEWETSYRANEPNEWWLEETPPPEPPYISIEYTEATCSLMDNCRLRGVHGTRLNTARTLLNDVRITDWFYYASFASASLIGCYFAQPLGIPYNWMGQTVASNRYQWNTTFIAGPNAGQPAPNFPRGAPIRNSTRGNNLFNKTFLRAGGGHDHPAANQPVIRFSAFAAGAGGTSQVSTFSESHFVGGRDMLSTQPASGGAHQSSPRLFEINACVIEGMEDTSTHIEADYGNIVVKNSLLISLSPTWSETTNARFFGHTTRGPFTGLRAINCTVIHRRATGGSSFIRMANPDWGLENCIFHTIAPDRLTGVMVPLTPLADLSADYAPLPATANYQSATGFIPLRDITGEARPAAASKGHKEPT